MTDSSTFAPKILSGIDVVDQAWGGLFRGGRYLAYGTNASGRSLLTTAYVAAGTRTLDTSLLISRLRQRDLAIRSASLQFDLVEAVASGLLRISRTPFELELIDRDDDSLESALKALASLIIDSSADRVVVDDFSPFTRFASNDRFRTAFARLLTEIEQAPSTLLIGMPEPANEASRRIIDFVGTLMTGCLHIRLGCSDGHSQRTVSLIPQIGHQTRRIDLFWPIDLIVAVGDASGAHVLSPRGERPSETVDRASELPLGGERPGSVPVPSPEETQQIERRDTGETTEEPSSFEFSVEPVAEPGAEAEVVFLDRDRFVDELQLYFDDYESSTTPFALVAMRLQEPQDGTGGDDFNAILGAIQAVLGREDSIFADPVVERIIVILGSGDTDGAQQLFSRLRTQLRQSFPNRADHLLNVVAAVVVPNGRPFTEAEDFIHYVLDEGA